MIVVVAVGADAHGGTSRVPPLEVVEWSNPSEAPIAADAGRGAPIGGAGHPDAITGDLRDKIWSPEFAQGCFLCQVSRFLTGLPDSSASASSSNPTAHR
jgi:hypothetical protein